MVTESGDEETAPGGAATLRMELVHLEVPVAPGYVGLVRAVVIAVAAVVPWLDDERLEDLRLAVSEACTGVMASQDELGDGTLALRCLLDGEWLRVDVEDVGDRGGHRTPGDEAVWGAQLIRSLVDDATFEPASGWRRVGMGLRASS